MENLIQDINYDPDYKEESPVVENSYSPLVPSPGPYYIPQYDPEVPKTIRRKVNLAGNNVLMPVSTFSTMSQKSATKKFLVEEEELEYDQPDTRSKRGI